MTEQKGGSGRRLGRFWWVAGTVVAIAIATVVLPHRPPSTGPGSSVEERKGGLPPEVSVVRAAGLRDQGTFMLDVREPDEWSEGHMPGATLIPLGDLESRLGEVPLDRPVVVICRSGNRSRRGRDILLGAGYAQATSMAGGMRAWEAAGHPTVAGP